MSAFLNVLHRSLSAAVAQAEAEAYQNDGNRQYEENEIERSKEYVEAEQDMEQGQIEESGLEYTEDLQNQQEEEYEEGKEYDAEVDEEQDADIVAVDEMCEETEEDIYDYEGQDYFMSEYEE